MFDPTELPAAGYARLVAVMARLRDPVHGCPWDLEQSLASLKPFLVEECYEALEAIDRLGPAARATGGARDDADPAAVAAHREELGDVLLQVVFQARLAEEFGWFDAEQVATGIAGKLIRRHPHVFVPPDEPERQATALEVEDVLVQWTRIKRDERLGAGAEVDKGVLGGLPRHLPALLRGQRIGDRAARVGFDWPDVHGALDKVDEELGELREALAEGDAVAIEQELGDLLFALTSVARHAGVEAEESLRGTLVRFGRRFERLERTMEAAGLESSGGEAPSIETLEAWWQQAKARTDPAR